MLEANAGMQRGDAQAGTNSKHAGALMIDSSRMLEVWAAGLPVDHSWRFNELPIRGNTDISRSVVPSTQPASAAMSRRTPEPCRAGDLRVAFRP
jgi:hypothetical protein